MTGTGSFRKLSFNLFETGDSSKIPEPPGIASGQIPKLIYEISKLRTIPSNYW